MLQKSSQHVYDGKCIHILTVEDELIDRKAIRRILNKSPDKYDLVEAHDFESARKCLISKPIDCVLLDYHLPGTKGLEVLEYVQSHFPDIAVIMLTGHQCIAVVDECLATGAQDYIDKSCLSSESLTHSIDFAIKRQIAQVNHRYDALHDPLTGLANRALLNENLTGALRRAQRNQTKVGLLLLDIDDFKQINDRYGHLTGDAALQHTALRMLAVIREQDTASRFGGDEFAIILESISQGDDCLRIAKEIHELSQSPWLHNDQLIQVRHSIGIAYCNSDNPSTNELIYRADKALYRAKTAGKNCYRTFDVELPCSESGNMLHHAS